MEWKTIEYKLPARLNRYITVENVNNTRSHFTQQRQQNIKHIHPMYVIDLCE